MRKLELVSRKAAFLGLLLLIGCSVSDKKSSTTEDSASTPSVTFKLLESVKTPLIQGGQNTEISLWRGNPDPGDYHRITIKEPGKEAVHFSDLEGWLISDPSLSEINILPSKYLSMPEASLPDKSRPLFL